MSFVTRLHLSMSAGRPALRRIRLGATTALALFGCATLAQAAPPAPPVSDGSSGSWNAQIGNGVYNSFNTDSGHVEGCNATQCTYQTNIPFTVGTYNNHTVHIFNFTDINIQSYNPPMTVYGSTPALFLANQGISIAIPLHFLNGGGAGGANAPLTPTAPGGKGGGKGGGTGGLGQASELTECGGIGVDTGSGGGGGGNVSAGQTGFPDFYPPAGPGPDPMYVPGPGGAHLARTLTGGGGGGGGGGGNYAGDFYTTAGGGGGGAVAFGSTTTIAITATGSVSSNGLPGETQAASAGSGGGGAAGTMYFFAPSGFTNAGSITAQGGAGGADMINTPVADCSGYVLETGPNGGNGAGGLVAVTAGTIANDGSIDVSDGGGGTANGGWIVFSGKVTKRGSLTGRK